MNQVTPHAMGRSGLRGRWAPAPTARRFLAIERLERRCPLDASGLLGDLDRGELADHLVRIDPPLDPPASYQAGATDPPAAPEPTAGEEAGQDNSGVAPQENGVGNFDSGPDDGTPLQDDGPAAGKAEPDDFLGEGGDSPPLSTGEAPDGGEPMEPNPPRGGDSDRPGDAFAPPLAPSGSISLHPPDGLRSGPSAPNLRAVPRPAPLGAAVNDGSNLNSPYQRSEFSLTKTRYYDQTDQDAVAAEGLLIEAALPLRSLARHGMPATAGIALDPDDAELTPPAATRSPVVATDAAAESALVRTTPPRDTSEPHATAALPHDVALVALLDAQPEGLSVVTVSHSGQRSTSSGATRVPGPQDLLRVSVQGHSAPPAGPPAGAEGGDPQRGSEPSQRPLEFLSGLSRWTALGWLLSHGIARRHVTGQCLIDRR